MIAKRQCIFFALSANLSSAFLHSQISTSRSRAHGSKSQDRSASTPLPAIIYGWDDDDDNSGYIDTSSNDFVHDYDPAAMSLFNHDMNNNNHLSTTGSRSIIELSEFMSSSLDQMSTFARLAVAHAPPERPIELKDIEDIQIVNISENHMELTVLLCEDSGCVNLFVPVNFKQGCAMNYDSDKSLLEACIWQNINELDSEAQLMLEHSATTITDKNHNNGIYNNFSP